jgi:gas vesicle protein GvpL/GvpF
MTGDEVERWAAERAPELRDRAEADAVAVLRDALVAAALGERRDDAAASLSRQRQRQRPTAVRAAPGGHLLWAYCVLRAGDPHPEDAAGVDESGRVERIEAAGLAALVSRVPRAEFGEEPLRRNLNDLAWLERAARAHESVLDQTLAASNIVPLRLCTVYDSDDSVRQMLARERGAFVQALDHLAGREEWSVKVLIDPGLLAEEARAYCDDARRLEPDTDSGGGAAYMLRRRAERQVREVGDTLAAQVADQVHTRLEELALDAVRRSPQNRDLSGHEGDMVLNAAYLVEADSVEELQRVAAGLQSEHRALGTRVDLTGPWPPYNFVPGGGTAAIT